MLVRFTMNDGKLTYIESTSVIALTESGTLEKPSTVIHHAATLVYSVVPHRIDAVAQMLGYKKGSDV